MRVLVIGGSGMLGSDLVPVLRDRGHEVIAPGSKELDITDPVSVAKIPAGELGQFDWCINCAAYTAVDRAETEVREATELNALGPAYLARACVGHGCRLLHVSTDFVFDGRATEPYTEGASTNPLGVYGRTKRDGENAVFEAHPNAIVVRTSWLFGSNGNSFPRTIIRAYESGKHLRVVADQVGCPTYTVNLALTISDLIEENAFPGMYHAAGPEAMSWHEFAERVLTTWTGRGVAVEPITTEEWPTAAARPKYSVLGNSVLTRADRPRTLSQALESLAARLRDDLGT